MMLKPRWSLWIALLLTACALFLRLYRVEDQWFGHDQAFWTHGAMDMIEGKSFPLVGQSPGLGPLTTYLTYAGFKVLGATARSGNIAFAFVTSLTALGIYFCGNRFYGPWTGVLASFLFVLNPAMLQYKSIWPQNLLLPILPVVFLLLHSVLSSAEPKRWHVIALGVATGLALQSHMTAFTLFGTIGISVLLFQRRRLLLFLVWLPAGITVGYLPNLVYEATHNAPNLKIIFGTVANPYKSASYRGLQPPLMVQAKRIYSTFCALIGGRVSGYTDLSGIRTTWPPRIHWLALEPILFLGFVAVVSARFLRRFLSAASVRKQGISLSDKLILIWTAVPILTHLVLRGGHLSLHYLLIVTPAPTIASARLVTLGWNEAKQWSGAAKAGVRGLLVLAMLSITLHHAYSLAYRVTNYGFGVVTLRKQRQAVHWILEQCQKDAAEACVADFRYLSEGTIYSYHLREALREVPPRRHNLYFMLNHGQKASLDNHLRSAGYGSVSYYYLVAPTLPNRLQSKVQKLLADKAEPSYTLGIPPERPRLIIYQIYRLEQELKW